MRTFKFLSIFIFLAVFINSKASAPVLGFGTKKGQFFKEVKFDQKINTEDQDDDSEHKRKRKPRGIAVDVPQISNISFEQQFVYSAFKPLWIEDSYSSFHHCISLKRGPPLS